MKRQSICEVCLLEANGLHFSIQSCRACAAFFRRTIVLNLSYLCQKDQNCDVTKKQRFCCRYCRFQRCLKQGMKPMMVQSTTNDQSPFDSELSTPPLNQTVISNSPNQEIELDDTAIPSSSFSNGPPESDLRAVSKNKQVLLKKKIDKIFEQTYSMNCGTELPIRLNVTQQAIVAIHKHNKRWPLCTPENLRLGFSLELETYMDYTFKEIENIAMFCMGLDDFAKLDKKQKVCLNECAIKWVLFRRFWHRFLPIERYLTLNRLQPNSSVTAFITYDGQLFDFDEKELEAVISRSDAEIRKLFEFLRPSCEKGIHLLGSQLIKLRPSEFEMIVCLLQCLWKVRDDDDLSPETRYAAEQIRNRISEEVHNYYLYEMNIPRYAPRIMKLMNIVSGLDVMEQQRREDNTVFKMFDIHPFDVFFSELSYP